MLDKLIKKYVEFVMNPAPSKSWKVMRFILHWLTLPIKLFLVSSIGISNIVMNLFIKDQLIPTMPSLETKQTYFNLILNHLPVFKGNHIELYCNDVPYYNIADGSNHNTDNQCSKQARYMFLMDKLGLRNDQQNVALATHMNQQWLARGYKRNPYDDQIQYNAATVPGDTLCNLNLAMLNSKSDLLTIKYEDMLGHLIDNDYSLLEGACPKKGFFGYELYQEELKKHYPEEIRMKSFLSMFQPGLECTGPQALTLLAALRVGDKKLGLPSAKKEYRKMLWRYGYGLISLFPASKQGANNENCLIALYTLSKLADTKLGKFFWKIPMVYCWALSRHEYSSYLTGMLEDCYPTTVSTTYLNKCSAYLYETKPLTFSFASGKQVKIGLDFVASALMLEKNPKELLK